jgi:hypothetical protein
VTREAPVAAGTAPIVLPTPDGEVAAPGSIASVAWHRLALIGLILVLILVILPAVLGAAGTQVLALV